MDSEYKLALKFEAEENDREAAKAYELAITEMQQPPLGCFTNLAAIYLVNAFRFERSQILKELQLPEENLPELFQKGKELYPHSIELAFWENYICYLYDWLGGKIMEEINPEFAQQHETLIPFFNLYNKKTGQYLDEAQALWEKIKGGKTCKERYIQSILVVKMPWSPYP